MSHKVGPKTEFLQIRLAPEDRARVAIVSADEHLEASTWARRIILKELDRLDRRKGASEE